MTITGAGSVTVRATQAGDSNYAAATPVEQGFTVNKATPVVTWTAPAAITYGTALSGTQLNATASVAGSFSYSPALGTVFNAGSQTLSVTFTPTDAVNYTNATKEITLTVEPKALTGSFTAADKVYDGTPAATVTGRSLGGIVGSDEVQLNGGTATFETKAQGAGKAVTLSGASLGGAKAPNYVLSGVSPTTAAITARTVTVTGLTAVGRAAMRADRFPAVPPLTKAPPADSGKSARSASQRSA